MASEITTTRDAGGAMKTTTPGAPPPQYNDLFTAIIKQRMAQQAQAQAQPAASQRPMPRRAPEPEEEQGGQQFVSSQGGPQLGTQQTSAPIGPRTVTRTVKDPFADPYTKMATGFDIGSREEKGYVGPDGRIQWEFEDIRPHGASGGFQGGGAESSLHATSNLQAKMPAYETGDPNVPPGRLENPEINRAQAGATAARVAQSRAPIDPRSRLDAGGINAARSGLVSAIRAGRL